MLQDWLMTCGPDVVPGSEEVMTESSFTRLQDFSNSTQVVMCECAFILAMQQQVTSQFLLNQFIRIYVPKFRFITLLIVKWYYKMESVSNGSLCLIYILNC